MTHVTRVFNPQTRSLTGVERRYAGQVGDSISTVLHFEYTQLGFLSEYVPYIMFGVYGDDGNPLIYGPEPENPSEVMMTALEDRIYFDGIEFTIPWAVTSKVKSARVDYQLFFVKVGVEFDGRNVAQLKPTEVVMSAIDSIALKPSITCDKRIRKDPCACPPFAPTGAEPNLLGWVQLWRDYGIVVPVTQDLKMPEFIDRFGETFEPTEEQQIANPPIIRLNFRTYNGTNDSSAEFTNVPVMIDGKTIYYQIPFGNTKNTYPLLRDTISDNQTIVYSSAKKGFIPYDVSGIYRFIGICTAQDLDRWDIEKVADEHVLVNGDVYACTDSRIFGTDELGRPQTYKAGTNWVWTEEEKFEPLTGDMDLSSYQLESSKIDSWDALVDDPEVVSEKFYPTARLTKATLDEKINLKQIIFNWSSDMEAMKSQVPCGTLVKGELDLVNDALDRKTDIVMAVPHWDASEEYSEDSTVVYDGTLYISTAGSNLSNVPVDELGEVSPFWAMVKGSGGGGTGAENPLKSTIIGDGTSTEFIIRHNFGTREVYVVTRDMNTNALVYPTYEAISVGSIKVKFTLPPAMNSYRVTVAPAVNITTPSAKSVDCDGDTWTVKHELGVTVMVQTFDADGTEIMGQVTVNDGNTVEVRFNHAHTGFMVIR